MNYLKTHCGTIAIGLFAIIAFLAPVIYIFKQIPSNQGTINIGEIVAPFLSLASVILLYFTFKEQRNFNKVQRASNDYEILAKLRTDISTLSEHISIVINTTSGRIPHQGISYIEELRKSTHPNNSIEENDFDHLYKGVIEIAELCFLYYTILEQSSLHNSIKNTFFNAITIHLENIRHLFHFYQQKEINIISGSNTTANDIWERYVNNKELLITIDAIRDERF